MSPTDAWQRTHTHPPPPAGSGIGERERERERERVSEEIEHSNETGRVTSALNEFNNSINCNCQGLKPIGLYLYSLNYREH